MALHNDLRLNKCYHDVPVEPPRYVFDGCSLQIANQPGDVGTASQTRGGYTCADSASVW